MDVTRVTMADFAAWLRAFPPTAVVGQAVSPCTCPLARYLRVLVPEAQAITVDQDVILIDAVAYSPLAWAADFVEILDLGMDGEVTDVTAEYALAVWEDVEFDLEASPASLVLLAAPRLMTE
ncbi:MAG: hypothetical protein H0X24_17150 [Ktedonobacterales bacterium]|nr:hypothetical protein [Ktedonobacterales bacterium]